jgi:prepilin-type N-terminal cleavage/methylation domain-containing protein
MTSRRAALAVHPAAAPVRRGFTLTEVLVAFTLLAIVAGGATSMLLSTSRGMHAQREITSTEDGLRVLQQTLNVMLRAAGANPGGITSSSILPRLEGVTGNATSCSRVRLVSDLNGDKDVSDSMEDVELYLQNQAVVGRWSAGASVDTIVAPVSTLTFSMQTAAGAAIACATSMPTARRVQVTIEAPRRSGGTQLIRRQWTIDLRNFQ